jgi:RimJ/RimL family protein N-acetyltransferase
MLNQQQQSQLLSLLDQANEHPEYKGYNLVKGDHYDAARIAIADDCGNIVGFLTPTFQKGYWRAGAIFVSPEQRGKGYATKAIIKFFHGNLTKRPARVWIAEYNTPSQKAFIKAGFLKGERYNAGDDILQIGHYYYLE